MADLAATGIVITALGGATSAVGRIKSNLDQAKAERDNADILDKQAEFADETARRKESIYEYEVQKLKGDQLSSFARGGVDIKGSPMAVQAETERLAFEERKAIRREGQMNALIARERAALARKNAGMLEDPLNNILGAGGPILGAASTIVGRKDI